MFDKKDVSSELPNIVHGMVKWAVEGESLTGEFIGAKKTVLDNGDTAIVVYIQGDEQRYALWGNKLLISQMIELKVKAGDLMTVTYQGEVENGAHTYKVLEVITANTPKLIEDFSALNTDDLPF